MRWRALGFGIAALAAVYGALNWSALRPEAAAAFEYIRAHAVSWTSPVEVEGGAAVLIDAETGEELYGKNGDKRLYPASTTKILTALIALEQGELGDRIAVGDEVNLRTADESSAWLREGQLLTLRDLLSAMMLPSGNDAARTVARYVARKEKGTDVSAEESIRYFAGLMNEKARELGANRSHFVNPHGLHDPDQYTTARDMALIAQAAMKLEAFRDIVNEREYTAAFAASAVTYENRNQLLQPDSPYYLEEADGIKTGFTDEAGYCLVSSASRGGTRLIAVVLHSTQNSVWSDSRRLLQYGFGEKGEPSAASGAMPAG